MRRAVLVVLLAVLAAVGAIGVDLHRDRQAAALVLTKVVPSGSASHQRAGPDQPVFVLAIGSDERPGLDGRRGDGLHVIGLNAAAGQATILNIPRDTWVDIPGRRQGRINEALNSGGPALQARTVEGLTGVPISYVLTTTFVGLEAMVDAMGGIEVDVAVDHNDRFSGANFRPGRHLLSGHQALAFSRNRYIPGGDISRTANQGQLMIHGLEALRARGTSPTDVIDHLDVLFRNVRTEGAGPADLYRLARAALAIEPGAVRNFTMPSRLGFVGPASVVFPGPGAGAVFADLADDAILQAH
jgi:polyisoprenyl-teichoic acid--peptidoglycan teichoic acid transferase